MQYTGIVLVSFQKGLVRSCEGADGTLPRGEVFGVLACTPPWPPGMHALVLAKGVPGRHGVRRWYLYGGALGGGGHVGKIIQEVVGLGAIGVRVPEEGASGVPV